MKRMIGVGVVFFAASGCASKGELSQLRDEQATLSPAVAELETRVVSLEAEVTALRAHPGVVNQHYLAAVLALVNGLSEVSGPSGGDQLADGTIDLIDCSAPGCPTTAGSPLPPAGAGVGGVVTDLGGATSVEDWYITSPFSQYSPVRPSWKGTYINGYDTAHTPPSTYNKYAHQSFSYTDVPDPAGAPSTPAGVTRYLYKVHNVSNGSPSGMRGELYRELIPVNGVTTWVDHWVLYAAYKEPAAGVDTKIVNRSVPTGDSLKDFLTKYHGNPSGICGASCTYAQINYTWQ